MSLPRRTEREDLDAYEDPGVVDSFGRGTPPWVWTLGPALISFGGVYLAYAYRQGILGYSSTSAGAIGLGYAAYTYMGDKAPLSDHNADLSALAGASALAVGQGILFAKRRNMLALHNVGTGVATASVFAYRLAIDYAASSSKPPKKSKK